MSDLDKVLQEVRDAFAIIGKYCIGCKRMVSESGIRFYSEVIPDINGKCPVCHKDRYCGENSV